MSQELLVRMDVERAMSSIASDRVLGEQKISQLRLEKMDNVIFNGTKQRKPAGLAEVSLTFENTKNLIPTEYTTVTILESSSGDRKQIWDQRCSVQVKGYSQSVFRYRYRHQIYAIIELGMVDEILQDKRTFKKKIIWTSCGCFQV